MPGVMVNAWGEVALATKMAECLVVAEGSSRWLGTGLLEEPLKL